MIATMMLPIQGTLRGNHSKCLDSEAADSVGSSHVDIIAKNYACVFCFIQNHI